MSRLCIFRLGRQVIPLINHLHSPFVAPDDCKYRADSAHQINLKFINRYRDTWPAGLQCLSGGILDLKPLVSHTYPLERAIDALETCADLANGSIKVQVVDEGEHGL